jgi:hypothetical protein
MQPLERISIAHLDLSDRNTLGQIFHILVIKPRATGAFATQQWELHLSLRSDMNSRSSDQGCQAAFFQSRIYFSRFAWTGGNEKPLRLFEQPGNVPPLVKEKTR